MAVYFFHCKINLEEWERSKEEIVMKDTMDHYLELGLKWNRIDVKFWLSQCYKKYIETIVKQRWNEMIVACFIFFVCLFWDYPSLSNKNYQESKLFLTVWIKDFIFFHFSREAVLGYIDVYMDNIITLIDFGKLLKCKKKTAA